MPSAHNAPRAAQATGARGSSNGFGAVIIRFSYNLAFFISGKHADLVFGKSGGLQLQTARCALWFSKITKTITDKSVPKWE
jgi:hypothetical protein